MQVQLPVATKANTQEAGADVKESGLFADASHLEDGGLTLKAHLLGRWGTHISKPISWKMGDLYLKVQFHIILAPQLKVSKSPGTGEL